MTNKLIQILCLVALLTPACLSAQNNVRKAFDQLIKNPKVHYTESHSLDKDPVLNTKESQSDVYNFTLPADQMPLVDNIINAFKEDENKAYTVSGGEADKSSRAIRLAVGDGHGSGVLINPAGYKYYYSCFTDPESKDEAKKYRYAYGICWKKTKDKIEGKLVVTYATTLQYRQNHNSRSTVVITGNNADNWFNTMVACIQKVDQPGSSQFSQNMYASQIYKHAQKTQTDKDISEADKDAVRELLKAILSGSDKRFNQQTIVLLNQALVNIK